MRVLLLGGTSEIGLAILSALDLEPDTEVRLAGRDVPRMEVAGKTLNCRRVSVVPYDARDVAGHQAFADSVCAGGVPDLVIAATGVLIPQPSVEADVSLAAAMIEANFTGQVTTLLAFGSHLKARGSGTIVVLSSVALTSWILEKSTAKLRRLKARALPSLACKARARSRLRAQT